MKVKTMISHTLHYRRQFHTPRLNRYIHRVKAHLTPSTPPDEDHNYKNSDHIVYTNNFWRSVKHLDDSFDTSINTHFTAHYVSTLMTQKWKRQHIIHTHLDDTNQICLAIKPFTIKDDMEYQKHMIQIMDNVIAWQVQEKLRDGILFATKMPRHSHPLIIPLNIYNE